jgi:hypothetical protein
MDHRPKVKLKIIKCLGNMCHHGLGKDFLDRNQKLDSTRKQ